MTLNCADSQGRLAINGDADECRPVGWFHMLLLADIGVMIITICVDDPQSDVVRDIHFVGQPSFCRAPEANRDVILIFLNLPYDFTGPINSMIMSGVTDAH